MSKEPEISVYVVNQGNTIGDWLRLPVNESEYIDFIKKIGISTEDGAGFQKYAIHDYESDYISIGEHVNLVDLNMLAVKMEEMDDQEKKLALSYCNKHNITDPLEILNVCEQVDELSYLHLNTDISGSREERLGYALIEEVDPDLKERLENIHLENIQLSSKSAYDYFDFERCGHDFLINNGYFIDDDIFMFSDSEPDRTYYSRDELVDQLNDSRLWTIKKAEEQIEANYNMIDGIFNNMETTSGPKSRLDEIRQMGKDNQAEPKEERNREREQRNRDDDREELQR